MYHLDPGSGYHPCRVGRSLAADHEERRSPRTVELVIDSEPLFPNEN